MPPQPDGIDAHTLYCAVLGCPVRHSASPAMQNAGILSLGLNWRYIAFEVAPEDLEAVIHATGRMGFIGLNLTVPHKERAFRMVDVLDESARAWQAVNTIRFEVQSGDGQWSTVGQGKPPSGSTRSVGYNTDAGALVLSLREDLEFKPRGTSVFLLGAGGAARSAALKLGAEGVGKLYIANRSPDKGQQLQKEISEKFPGTEAIFGYPPGNVDLILNATSLGLKSGDGMAVDEKLFPLRRARLAYDMIYTPAETVFLRRARELGLRAANGEGMLLYQGVKALEIWSGKPAPVDKMREALRKHLYG